MKSRLSRAAGMNINGRSCRCRAVRVVRARRPTELSVQVVAGGNSMKLNGAAECNEGIEERDEAAEQRACGEEQQSKETEGRYSETISYSTICTRTTWCRPIYQH